MGKFPLKKKTKTKRLFLPRGFLLVEAHGFCFNHRPDHLSKSTGSDSIWRQVENVSGLPRWRHCLFHFAGRTSSARCRNLTLPTKHVCFVRTVKTRIFRTAVTHPDTVDKPVLLLIKSCSVKSLKKALPSRHQREIRSFLGACNGYRFMVYNFAHTASTLNEMLQKGIFKIFSNLTLQQLVSFQTIINVLTSAPIQNLLEPHQPYFIVMGASGYRIACASFFETRKISVALSVTSAEHSMRPNKILHRRKRNVSPWSELCKRFTRDCLRNS